MVVVIGSCANTGYPEGGIKDIVPPKVEKSTPEANALNFKGKEVDIQFDEFIKVLEMDTKFVSSPPLKNKPTIQARGKNLIVKFDEELQPNTTYTLDFADAIRDNNEGNVLKDFRFSFSTGTVIDSFAVSGNVYDSKDLQPIASCLVLLYSNLSDTAFTSEVPLRLAKTDQRGFFSIHNIAQGTYRIFALNDANRNYFFDQPGEEIGWNKDTFSPSIEMQTVRDTALLKTILKKDSVNIDSLGIKKEKVYLPNRLQLFMYQEDFKKQYVENQERKDRSKVNIFFSRPLIGDIDLKLQSDTSRKVSSWAIRQNSLNRDTITFWITDTLVSNQDSLAFTLKYNTTDSLDKVYAKVDTIVTYFFEKQAPKKRLKKGEIVPKPVFAISGMPASHEIQLPYPIILASPAVSFNESGVKLFVQRDSVKKEIPFEIIKDTLLATRYYIKNKWERDVTYFLTVDSATFTNSYGVVNNSINRKFEIKSESSYGLLLFTIENGAENWLVQLIDPKESVIRQQYVPKNGKMAFPLIESGSYFLKIVVDENRNKKQDIGNYKLGILPERILYYPEKLSIRANWRHDVKWDASTFDLEKFVKVNRTQVKKRKE